MEFSSIITDWILTKDDDRGRSESVFNLLGISLVNMLEGVFRTSSPFLSYVVIDQRKQVLAIFKFISDSLKEMIVVLSLIGDPGALEKRRLGRMKDDMQRLIEQFEDLTPMQREKFANQLMLQKSPNNVSSDTSLSNPM